MLASALANRLKRQVTIQHRTESGTADAYGTDIPSMVDVKVMGELQQRSRDEAEGTVSQTGWLLFLPASTPIDTNDTVLVGGESYEVIGDPWQAFNPRTGVFEHIEATLRRTSGEEVPTP